MAIGVLANEGQNLLLPGMYQEYKLWSVFF
jgi:hypothetical protein